MKNLSKNIRNGGVKKFSASDLGVRTQGKGSFYRIKSSDQQYIDNYNKIDWNYKKYKKEDDE
tara:strand:+ start:2039 stop:2224 length:186 start_codon:yes stop_codon:yes gene_type:complete